ncbi:relaxase/mobilization nuclease domain-containing protein (plasmid) [Campylobacter lari subsp. concheus]|uniref:relaxase/mobilization nuclease domain-containing protein n=1 Tax=Campylobacter lari TaxID=201 RepID=UPI0039906200
MIIKFFKNKKGENGGLPSVDYLLNAQRVKNGTAKILKGDENTTREIIKSLNFKHKVCAGCLSFEEQNIDENTKKEIMESFEEMLLTPAMQGRLNILWVEHTDKNRLELNFVIPRIDLETQKSFSPYFHKSDFKRVDLWGDFVNLSYGFSNPKDPTKEQNIKNINHHAKTFKDHKELDRHFREIIATGVKNRDELIYYIETDLKGLVEITRKGENYLSLKLPNDKKAVRYKGEIYTNGSYADIFREKREREQREIREFGKSKNGENIEKYRTELDKLIEFKTGYYRNKYKSNIEENVREHGRTSNDKHNEVNSNLANTNNNHQHSNLLHSNTTENVTKQMDFRQRNANHTDKGHQEHRRHENGELSSNTQQGRISDELHREYINAITERKRRANARARNTYEREQRTNTRKRDINSKTRNYDERKQRAFNNYGKSRKTNQEFTRTSFANSTRLRKRARKLQSKRIARSFNKIQPRLKRVERQRGLIRAIQDIATIIRSIRDRAIERRINNANTQELHARLRKVFSRTAKRIFKDSGFKIERELKNEERQLLLTKKREKERNRQFSRTR